MDYPNVLAKEFKGQVANSSINIWHPPHMDCFMLAIKQRLESPKVVCSKFLGLIIVHVIKITLTNFDGCHKVTYKYVLHLGKLDKKHALILTWAKCMQTSVESVGHTSVHVELCLLICILVHSHFHQQDSIVYHHFFGKAQHENPLSFDVTQDFVPFSFHNFNQFCEFQMPFRGMCKIGNVLHQKKH